MRWRRIRLVLWLAAWSFWAFVGVQLYRFYPRTLGDSKAKLPLGQFECVLGFVPDEPLVLTTLGQFYFNSVFMGEASPDPAEMRVWRLDDCSVARRWLPDASGGYAWDLHHGKLFFNSLHAPMDAPTVVDVHSGRETRLKCRTANLSAGADFHKDFPWVAFLGSLPEDPVDIEQNRRVVVADLGTGEIVATIPGCGPPIPDVTYEAPRFLPGSKTLLLVVKELGKPQKLVAWDLFEKKPRAQWSNLPSGRVAATSGNGRMVWKSNGRKLPVDYLIDVEEGRVSAVYLAEERRGMFQGPPEVFDLRDERHLTPDGSTVVETSGRTVRDFESGALLWQMKLGGWIEVDAARGEVGKWDPSSGPLLSAWNEWIGGWIPTLRMVGRYEVRDLRTGALLYNCDSRSVQAAEFQTLKDGGTVIVDRSGTIYDYPARVQWVHLAAMQTLLAAPLVAAWAWGAIRRRSRRNQTQAIS